MAEHDVRTAAPAEAWEEEILARHRWGRHGQEKAQAELERLRELRRQAEPLEEVSRQLVEQIIGPEICNWALENTVLELCLAIGSGVPLDHGTGHLATVTDARWRQIWAYYLTCRHWLAGEHRPRNGYAALLAVCDPEGDMQRHVTGMLGERCRLKELYVERFCLCLQAWIDQVAPPDRPQQVGWRAAADAIDAEIRQIEGDPAIPIDQVMRLDDRSILQPCHHKLFRRYDILLSSIGELSWRQAMPPQPATAIERAEAVERLVRALECWQSGRGPALGDVQADPRCGQMARLLGPPTPAKRFLAALLASLLACQALHARQRGQKRLDVAGQDASSA